MIILCNNLDNIAQREGTCAKKTHALYLHSSTNVNPNGDENFDNKSRNTLITNVN